MIVRAPGLTKAGTTSQALVELIDIMPTLADLCGVELAEEVHGTSMKPLLSDPKAKGKDAVYTVVSRGSVLGRSIRTQRWRYAEWGDPDDNELYDLQTDPREHRNLARSPEYAKQVKVMRTVLNSTHQRAAALGVRTATAK
jgi:arylsulfatase A-like enzyme